MNRNFAERKLVVDFDSTKVKEAMKLVFATSNTTYMNPEIDEILGTYNFSMMRNIFTGGKMAVTVVSVGEAKTEINANIKNHGGGRLDDVVLEGIMNDFFKTLSLALSGQITMQPKAVVPQNSGGCMGMLLILIALAFVLISSCAKEDNTGGNVGGNNNTGGTYTGCPTTAACGCSNINKPQCNTTCCKWVVGSGCGCR